MNSRVFFAIFLSDLSMLIAIDFSSILESSDLTLRNYAAFCNKKSTLFTHGSITDVSRQVKADFKIAERQYDDYFKTPRDKLFAHMGETLLDQEAVNHMMDRVGTTKMTSLLQSLMKILSSIWFAYNGKQLCFEIKKEIDYKKLAYTICNAYGNTKFV